MSTPLCRDSHQTNPWYKAIYFACFFALDVPLYKQRGGFAFRTLEVAVACCRVGVPIRRYGRVWWHDYG